MRSRDLIALGLLASSLAGCRNDMYDQPKYKPMDPSSFFYDGTSARPLVTGTVARGDVADDVLDPRIGSGVVDGKEVDEFPFEVDRKTVERGRQRFNIFCTPCHGAIGNGRGMIVQRGFSPPPSFHSATVKAQPVGHYFQVMTHGHGTMYSYASRIPPRDRWAIAAYIRVLQLSQNAKIDELEPSDRSALNVSAALPSTRSREAAR